MMKKEKNEVLKENFLARNIEFEYYSNQNDLLFDLKKELDEHESIGVGNSQTLKTLGISQLIYDSGKVVYDKTLESTKAGIRRAKKLALTSDCYISSCNAISEDGKIVNIDHSGNRVAAMTYGPERVILIVGENKLKKNEKEALKRALDIATPQNARRAEIESPCSKGESCNMCIQKVRVCNYISIIRGQHEYGRMKVMMLNENIGF